MATLADVTWHDDAQAIGAALQAARSVRIASDPHLAPWLAAWAKSGVRLAVDTPPALFPPVERRCDSFSQWWTRTTRGIQSAAELLAGAAERRAALAHREGRG